MLRISLDVSPEDIAKARKVLDVFESILAGGQPAVAPSVAAPPTPPVAAPAPPVAAPPAAPAMPPPAVGVVPAGGGMAVGVVPAAPPEPVGIDPLSDVGLQSYVTEIVQAGKAQVPQILGLLTKHGASRISELAQARRPAFNADLKALVQATVPF